MANIGERAADLQVGDRIICNDGSVWLRVVSVHRPALAPNVVDVTTHLRVGGPRGPNYVMHYAPDDRVEIIRL